jgi:hypothetical protein
VSVVSDLNVPTNELPHETLNAPSVPMATTNLLLYDWNLVSAGCVLTQSVLDSLLLQSLQNPDIVSFWTTLLDHRHFTRQPRREAFENSAAPVMTHHRRDSSSVSTLTIARFSMARGNSRLFARPLSTGSGLSGEGTGTASAGRGEWAESRLPLLRIKCPSLFVGKTFGDIFTDYVISRGIIIIAIYRSHDGRASQPSSRGAHSEHTSGILPLVCIAPGTKFIMETHDFIFGLNCCPTI